MARTRAPSPRSSPWQSQGRDGPGGVTSFAAPEPQILWEEYKGASRQRRRAEARERLILHYAPLVKYVASRVATGLPPRVELSDLMSYGMFGLMDALEKFDPARHTRFETYAMARIRGAIIDELRSLDWVPRSVRSKGRQIDNAYEEVEGRLKRAPTDAEVAQHLGIGLGDLRDALMQISFASVVALDELVSGPGGEGASLLDGLSDLAAGDAAAGLESRESRQMLAEGIRSLPERERVVIALYYFEGLTLAEIGEVLQVTESRVCQIHTKAVRKLRDQLTDRGDD